MAVILEIAQRHIINTFSPSSPYVYSFIPGTPPLASFWVDVFGAEQNVNNKVINVGEFIRDYSVAYQETQTLAECQALEKSFFWDFDNQIGYVHFEHDQEGLTATYQYSDYLGYSDNNVLKISNQLFTPMIVQTPNIRSSQDLLNYSKLAFPAGSVRLKNMQETYNGKTEGEFDKFIESDIYGNEVILYYLDDAIQNPTRDDLQLQKTMYIEDWDITPEYLTLATQDKRKLQNLSIPTEKFTTEDYPDIGDYEKNVIPLMFGTVEEAEAIPVNSAATFGAVNYRVAQFLQSLGTVWVDIEGLWVDKTTYVYDINLATGEFSLPELHGRSGNGAIRLCKVVQAVGEAVSKTTDIIKSIRQRYLGLEFNNSNYNTAEWITESAPLVGGSLLINESTEMFEVFRIIQNGSVERFRLEIEDKCTIRRDSNNRTSSGYIPRAKIQNLPSFPVKSESRYVFGSVKVNYAKSYIKDSYKDVENDDFAIEVKRKYGSQQEFPVDSVLFNPAYAESRALYEAERLKSIALIGSLELMGAEFLNVRIFDIFTAELSFENRSYFGTRKIKITGINPDMKDRNNSVTIQVLEEV